METVRAFLIKKDHLSPTTPVTVKRLEGGFWNKVYRIQGNGVDWVFKSFSGKADKPSLYPKLPESEAKALEFLNSHDIAPTFIAYYPANHDHPANLLYKFLPGQMWQGKVADVGSLLKRLHNLVPPTSFRTLAYEPESLLKEGDKLLCACVEDKAALTLKTLRPDIKSVQAPHRLSLIHTDVWHGNIISSAGKHYLIDWQCPGLGDPTEDIWTFLRSGYQKLLGHDLFTKAQELSFFNRYRGDAERLETLHSYYSYRLAAHCLMRKQDLADSKPAVARVYAHLFEHHLKALS